MCSSTSSLVIMEKVLSVVAMALGLLSFQLHTLTNHPTWMVLFQDSSSVSLALSPNILAKKDYKGHCLELMVILTRILILMSYVCSSPVFVSYCSGFYNTSVCLAWFSSSWLSSSYCLDAVSYHWLKFPGQSPACSRHWSLLLPHLIFTLILSILPGRQGNWVPLSPLSIVT